MMFRLRRCSIRTGALLILALLSGGCAGTGAVSDHTERRSAGDTGRHHSSSDRHRQSVEVELDGEYGFTLTEVVRIDGDVRRDYQEGVALLQAGQLEAGIELLERVVEAAPDVTNPHIDLGVAYSRLGRYEASEASLRSALALAPNHPAALNELGILLRRTGRFEAARASYEQALYLTSG